jgi:hypothetical protein
MIPLNHRRDHSGWNSNVVEINNFFSAKIECTQRICDERKHYTFVNTCIGEFDDLRRGGTRFEVRWHFDFGRELRGRRVGNALFVGLSQCFFEICICQSFGGEFDGGRFGWSRNFSGGGNGFWG